MTTDPNRKRSRVACTSCQSRKRKCSGGQPCTICAQCGTECHYDYFSRKKKDVKPSPYSGNYLQQSNVQAPGSTTATGPGSGGGDHPSAGREERGRSSPAETEAVYPTPLEANSGAAFVRRLGLKIDSAQTKLHRFAWNIGVRAPPLPPPKPRPIVDIITQEDMRTTVAIWFEKMDPSYGFIDRDHLLRQVSRRWLSPSSDSALGYGLYDGVLCGIAAMGYLYSRHRASPTEADLVESARVLLEQYAPSEPPTVDLVTGWALRVSYMRMTASPHATWLASCTLMHLIEAAGLHIELPDPEIKKEIRNPTSDDDYQPSADLRRRIFCMARHLNVWVSFELGRSRVVLHGANSLPPIRRGDATSTEVFELLPTSEALDPAKSQDARDLEAALAEVLDGVHYQKVVILGQCNLALCIFRRLRALSSSISPKLQDQVLSLSTTALRVARELNASYSPWHHIANVPFQIVCTLLAMDNRQSLALLEDAMNTLREVATQYDTDVMREAYSTAYLLVLLHQRRKEDDTKTIGRVLRINNVPTFPPPDQDGPGGPPSNGDNNNNPGPPLPVAAPAPAPPAPAMAPTTHGIPPPNAINNPNTSPMAHNMTSHPVPHNMAAVPHGHSQTPGPPVQGGSGQGQAHLPLHHSEFSWLGDLMIDMPSLQNFDLDQFLTMDVPWPLPEMGI